MLSIAASEWLNKQDFMNGLSVNLLGVIEVTLSLLPLVRKAQGHVVHVSSVTSQLSLFGGGYCISKHFLAPYYMSCRRELPSFWVKVTITEPGFFKTNMTNTKKIILRLQEVWNCISSEVKDVYGEKFLESCLKSLKLMEHKCSPDLSLVTECMEYALTACHPRTQYSAGWDSKLFYLPLNYLPTFLVDAFLYLSSPKPAKAL
ncbi:PREDICTED: retinol dehydrogenase 7-like [Chinchilla lanigera]|uniref:retinol dehydrogenase 7-like n=1 Tax=Chinchilla lanigera TaxID=34839 RepID=UPI0006978DE6|nr:PREDICTED: retinol dehydrogenase 7-like [Chinchilla lanigera]